MAIGIQLPADTLIGSYVESFVDLDSAAGQITANFTAVPSGEVWLVQSAACWDSITDIAMCKIRKNVGGTDYTLAVKNPAGLNDAAQIYAAVLLFPTEYLSFQWATVVLHDDIFAHAIGLKFMIDFGI
jgi:hypothetical protein